MHNTMYLITKLISSQRIRIVKLFSFDARNQKSTRWFIFSQFRRHSTIVCTIGQRYRIVSHCIPLVRVSLLIGTVRLMGIGVLTCFAKPCTSTAMSRLMEHAIAVTTIWFANLISSLYSHSSNYSVFREIQYVLGEAERVVLTRT